MRVVNLCSTLRQGEPYARSFIAQVEALSQRGWRLGTVTLVCDGDRLVDPHLATYAQRCTSARVIFEAEAEAPSGSMARKAAQWASIGNQALQSALDSPCTHVLYVEADLCFPFDLVDQLLAREADIVAPLVFLGGSFYDSWGFRTLQGDRIWDFGTVDPRGPAIELGSVGSCALIRAEVLDRGVRFPARYDDGLFVGLCAAARSLGYHVWVDPATSIVHPTSSWRRQVWVVEHLSVGLADGRRFQFDVDLVLARLSDVFVRETIQLAYDRCFHQVPAGLYALTVHLDSTTRTQRWCFDAVAGGESPDAGNEVRISPRATIRDANQAELQPMEL